MCTANPWNAMAFTMLCTVATQSWVAGTEMGFSPSVLTLQVSLTWETSNCVGLPRAETGVTSVWWRLMSTGRMKVVSMYHSITEQC